MAARTSTQAGVWSASATWGGSAAPGDGDTASIGHAVTDDTGGAVGTSPNDTTTNVIALTAGGSLTLATGVTRTVKGNVTMANGTTMTLGAGSAIVFDASASGGSPSYWLNNPGFNTYAFNGTSGSRCSISAVSGRTWSWFANLSGLTATYTDFTRAAVFDGGTITGDISMSDCIATGCGRLNLATTSTTLSLAIARCLFTGGTHADDDVRLSYTGTHTSGTRLFERNTLSKAMNYTGKGLTVRRNYIGGIWTLATGSTLAACRENFFANAVSTTGSNMRFESDTRRNYFYAPSGTNPHYCQVQSNATDVIIEQSVFECGGTWATDTGDCVFPFDSGASHVVTVANCLAIPFSLAGQTNVAGNLITLYSPDATRTVWVRRNTSVGPNASLTGFLDVAEGSAGHADELSSAKSNLVSGGGSNRLVVRVSGTTNGVVTAAGVTNNWYHDGAEGDNGLGFDDQAGSLDLWDGTAATGGDAAAAGISHAGTADPLLYATTRNTRTWAVDRGYGTTTADALTALQADPRRIADLIDYVFAGFKPQNPACRTAGHDGMCVGAANYHDTARTGVGIGKVRAFLTA